MVTKLVLITVGVVIGAVGVMVVACVIAGKKADAKMSEWVYKDDFKR